MTTELALTLLYAELLHNRGLYGLASEHLAIRKTLVRAGEDATLEMPL